MLHRRAIERGREAHPLHPSGLKFCDRERLALDCDREGVAARRRVGVDEGDFGLYFRQRALRAAVRAAVGIEGS